MRFQGRDFGLEHTINLRLVQSEHIAKSEASEVIGGRVESLKRSSPGERQDTCAQQSQRAAESHHSARSEWLKRRTAKRRARVVQVGEFKISQHVTR